MIRVGLLCAATYGFGGPRTPGCPHGTAFATAFNGHDAEKRRAYDWRVFTVASRRLPDVRVVKVWDSDRVWAERLADVCAIPEVCDTPEECASGVDAVIAADDGSCEQGEYALPALRRGIPTFVDKPIAVTARRAREIVDVARRHGAPLLSASALRFVPDVAALREAVRAGELGRVNLATTVCGNDLIYYGIHALEMAYGVLGAGAVSCVNVGQPGRNVVRVRFGDGRDLVLMVAEREHMRAGYQIDLFGQKGWRTVQPALADLYLYLMEQFLGMVRRGDKEVVPLDEMVEVIAVLEAGKRSLAAGREVTVREVFEVAE